jgi:hypothetical protein
MTIVLMKIAIIAAFLYLLIAAAYVAIDIFLSLPRYQSKGGATLNTRLYATRLILIWLGMVVSGTLVAAYSLGQIWIR